MLRTDARTGWARISRALVHVAILATGMAGLATFAVSMSEATPAPPERIALGPDPDSRTDIPADPAVEPGPSRTVRVVYPGW